jgi:predicted phosphodiesterase
MIKNFFLYLLLVVAFSANAKTTFIVVGHIYSIASNKETMQRLATEFKKLNPDYIFILGDAYLQKKEVYSFFKDNFHNKIFFAPGNHDMSDNSLNDYRKNVGYLYKNIESDDIIFTIINSLDGIEDISNNLNILLQNKVNKKRIIMSHHRLWDDTLLSRAPYMHDKSYYFSELFPTMSGKVDAIFSGNSNTQYFSNYGKNIRQNINNIFFVDKIGDIDLYSVGSRGGNSPKIGFVYAVEENNTLSVIPKYIYTDSNAKDLFSTGIVKPLIYSEVPLNKYDLEYILRNVYSGIEKKYLLIIIFFISIAVIYLFLKAFKK